MRALVMILKCVDSDYFATASADVHKQNLVVFFPNVDSGSEFLLLEPSREPISPWLDKDRLLQRQMPFVDKSSNYLKPPKNVADSLLKLLVPHPLPYVRNSVLARGTLPMLPRFPRAQKSVGFEIPSVSDETNQPMHGTKILFQCSLVSRRSCGPRISKLTNILEYVGLSLQAASTVTLQQSLDSNTFLFEVEEKLELPQYQEVQFLDEICSLSAKAAVARDTSPAVIYWAPLSLSSMCTPEVPNQKIPRAELFDLLKLRSEQGVSRTQVLPTLALEHLYGDGHINGENGTPVFEIPTFPEWEQPFDAAKLLSWYPSTSSKIDVDKLPGLPFTSFQTLLVARELSSQNYITFLPVPEVSEIAAKDMARSTFNDLGTCVRQRSSFFNLEWHLSGTNCCFERCQALLHQTQPEWTALVLEYTGSGSPPLSGIVQLVDDGCSSHTPDVLHTAGHATQEIMKEKRQPTIVERVGTDVHESQVQQQEEEHNFVMSRHQQGPIVRVMPVDHQPDDLGAYMRARVKSVGTAQRKQAPSVHPELETQHQCYSAKVVPPAITPTEIAVGVSRPVKEVLVAACKDYQRLSVQDVKPAEWEGPDFGLDPSGTEEIQKRIQDLVLRFGESKRVELRRLIGLYVIRQTAYNCFHHGVRVAHLYLESQEESENLEFLKPLTRSVKSCLDAGYAAVKEGGEDHPKIPLLLSLLKRFCSAEACATDSQGRGVRKNILIVAERRTFFTIYWQLVELGLSPYQFDREEMYLDQGQVDRSKLAIMLQKVNEALCFTDCLLLPPQYLVEGFPLQNFSPVVLYSSLHIQKLQPCGVALYVFQMASPGDLLAPASDTMTLSSSPGCTNLVEPNDIPEATSLSKKQVRTTKADVLQQEKVVVVENVRDTQCSLSWPRRSPQHHLLNVEKDGVEIIEREMHLPVDLVLSPSTCLFVYTLEKLNVDKVLLSQRPVEVLSAAVEVIIDDHMRASSVAYHRCVMIFEGPRPFIDGIQAMLDDIFCAGIALDMHTECFLSTHSSSTQSIVKRQIRLCGCQLQAAEETETVAEAFLASFPSLNPLSALAVLSCGIPLPVFLCLGLDQQDSELQKFGVSRDRTRLAHLQMNADQSEEEQNAAPSAEPLSSAWEHPSISAENALSAERYSMCEEPADAELREFQQISHKGQSHQPDRDVPATRKIHQDIRYTAGCGAAGTPHTDRGWEGERSIPASRPFRAYEAFTTFAPEAMNSTGAANSGRVRTYPPPRRSQGESTDEGIGGGGSRVIKRGGLQNGERLWESKRGVEPLLPPMTRSGFGNVVAEEPSARIFPSAAEIAGDAESSESPPPDFPPVSCLDDSEREQSPLNKYMETFSEGPEYTRRERMRSSRQHERAAGSVRGTLDRWLTEKRSEEPKQAERRGKGTSQNPGGRHLSAAKGGENPTNSPILFSPLRPKQKTAVQTEEFGAEDGMEESWKEQGPKWSLQQMGHNKTPHKAGQRRVFGPPPGASCGKRKRGVSSDMFSTFSHNTPAKSAACSFWDQSPQAAAGPSLKEKMTSWTPLDKRSKEVLTFERSGPRANKQSKLVWRKAAGGNKGGPGYDASYTM